MSKGTSSPAARADDRPITPEDPRYADLVGRGFNRRFVGRPDYVRVVGSTEQLIDALETAVRDRRRLAVRSGGHCLEGFVGDPAVKALIDMSAMTGVTYDAERRAFAVEGGTTLREVYERLSRGWGVLIPAGQSPAVGIGGHIVGGAHGFLHRQHGLGADHLYAVEVVVVDADGRARAVVATRDPADPNRDLWWAHTGAGGGNLGVVTRYWFRSPEADERDDAAALLPRAPESVLVFRASWNWADLDERGLVRLGRNFGEWCRRHSAPGARECALFSTLSFSPRLAGTVDLKGIVTTGTDAQSLFEEHVGALATNVGAPATRTTERASWLGFALRPFPELFVPGLDGAFVKVKDALLREGLAEHQLAVAYRHLADPAAAGALTLMTYGGAVNRVAPEATATASRAAVMEIGCATGWGDPRDEQRSLAWLRAFYRELFADTGGVPVPGAAYDGALINHPDVDLADPAWNSSGVPWSTIYYQGNYPRLRAIKTRFDPGNVFRHALSIEPA
jgi:FAD/FMN-containing dehydrogenase